MASFLSRDVDVAETNRVDEPQKSKSVQTGKERVTHMHGRTEMRDMVPESGALTTTDASRKRFCSEQSATIETISFIDRCHSSASVARARLSFAYRQSFQGTQTALTLCILRTAPHDRVNSTMSYLLRDSHDEQTAISGCASSGCRVSCCSAFHAGNIRQTRAIDLLLLLQVDVANSSYIDW